MALFKKPLPDILESVLKVNILDHQMCSDHCERSGNKNEILLDINELVQKQLQLEMDSGKENKLKKQNLKGGLYQPRANIFLEFMDNRIYL